MLYQLHVQYYFHSYQNMVKIVTHSFRYCYYYNQNTDTNLDLSHITMNQSQPMKQHQVAVNQPTVNLPAIGSDLHLSGTLRTDKPPNGCMTYSFCKKKQNNKQHTNNHVKSVMTIANRNKGLLYLKFASIKQLLNFFTMLQFLG